MCPDKKRFHPFEKQKGYLFSPRKLHEIAVNASKLPDRSKMFDFVIDAVAKEYPGHIHTTKRWVYNNAGGAMGQMTLLHASLREYLILFGSSLGTEGHSGRYSAEVFDFVFDGDMWVELEGMMDRKEFKPGSAAYLPAKVVKHYCIKDHSWMLEYGRGHSTIISMMPFGLADSLISTLDYRVLLRTLYYYATMTTRELFVKGKDLGLLLKFLLILLIVFGGLYWLFTTFIL